MKTSTAKPRIRRRGVHFVGIFLLYLTEKVDNAGPELDGEYSKLECAGSTVFQFPDNSKRLKYRTDLECDGWVLEENSAPPSSMDIFHCTDDTVTSTQMLISTSHKSYA